MRKKILSVYSFIFRFGGLAIAALSAFVSASLAFEIARDGFVLINGEPDFSGQAIAVAICTPLIGVVIGMAVLCLVPKISPGSESSDKKDAG
jgi:hypothetical protein